MRLTRFAEAGWSMGQLLRRRSLAFSPEVADFFNPFHDWWAHPKQPWIYPNQPQAPPASAVQELNAAVERPEPGVGDRPSFPQGVRLFLTQKQVSIIDERTTLDDVRHCGQWPRPGGYH